MAGRLFCGGGKLKLLSSCRVQASHSVASPVTEHGLEGCRL